MVTTSRLTYIPSRRSISCSQPGANATDSRRRHLHLDELLATDLVRSRQNATNRSLHIQVVLSSDRAVGAYVFA